MCVLVGKEWKSLFKWIEHCIERFGGKIEQDALMKVKGSQKAGLQRFRETYHRIKLERYTKSRAGRI